MNWVPAYVALGSNLSEPRRQIETALQRLAAIPETRLVATSRLYRAIPMGPQDQPEFVNAAAGLLTRLDPRALLGHLQDIERAMGRTPPAVRWGPRIIDLDLLLYGSLQLNAPGLQLPHPGVHERNFVLYPLADFAPALQVPNYGSVAELARRLGADGLKPVLSQSMPR